MASGRLIFKVDVKERS